MINEHTVAMINCDHPEGDTCLLHSCVYWYRYYSNDEKYNKLGIIVYYLVRKSRDYKLLYGIW